MIQIFTLSYYVIRNEQQTMYTLVFASYTKVNLKNLNKVLKIFRLAPMLKAALLVSADKLSKIKRSPMVLVGSRDHVTQLTK